MLWDRQFLKVSAKKVNVGYRQLITYITALKMCISTELLGLSKLMLPPSTSKESHRTETHTKMTRKQK